MVVIYIDWHVWTRWILKKKILEFPDTKVIALDRDPKSKTIAIKFKKNLKIDLIFIIGNLAI